MHTLKTCDGILLAVTPAGGWVVIQWSSSIHANAQTACDALVVALPVELSFAAIATQHVQWPGVWIHIPRLQHAMHTWAGSCFDEGLPGLDHALTKVFRIPMPSMSFSIGNDFHGFGIRKTIVKAHFSTMMLCMNADLASEHRRKTCIILQHL